MTDKTDLIREIHEYVTTHGGENTATHLLVQAASAIQTQAAELEAVGAGGVQPLRKAPAEPYSLDSDPDGIRAMVADAITGALAFGAQGINPPPEGHWLAPFWNAARAELAAPQPAPAPLSDDAKDAARWRWLSEHIGAAWNEGKFTSLVRIVSDKNRAALNASIDRMMTGDWSDAALAAQGGAA